MDLVFVKNEELLGAVCVDLTKVGQVVHGDNAVKEIQLSKAVKSEEDKVLGTVYDNINKVDYSSATDVIVLYTKESYFSYHAPVKEIYYRTMAYSNHGSLEMKETLSIRFQEDMKTVTDMENKLMFCGEDCPHRKDAHCLKFNADLEPYNNKYIVCKNCFLHSSGDSIVQKYREAYTKMLSTYDEKK